MSPPISSVARAAIALCFTVITGCGGSTAAQPTEVDLGRSPSDPQSKTTEEEDAARAERAKSRPSPVSQEPVDPAEEPGYLTLVCDPSCDEVSHEGRPLGPSPVVHAPIAPGSRRITVSNGGSGHKIITVVIRSGQVSALRVNMSGTGPLVLPPQAAPGSSAAAQAGAQPGATSTLSPQPPMVEMRAQLEPKAWAGKATLEELRLLRAICAYMADLPCRDRAAALMKAQAPSASSP
jgi:hypothetical protein